METIQQYNAIVLASSQIFEKKIKDYGTSWRVLRPISIVDQIYIKAWRIRQLQEMKGPQLVEDSISDELKAIVNYGYIALIQLALPTDHRFDLTAEEAIAAYQTQYELVRDLMLRKNHDYGEAWRNMSQASFVDLILTKLIRIKQIIANDNQTIASEGSDANFADIINYAIFALILISEGN